MLYYNTKSTTCISARRSSNNKDKIYKKCSCHQAADEFCLLVLFLFYYLLLWLRLMHELQLVFQKFHVNLKPKAKQRSKGRRETNEGWGGKLAMTWIRWGWRRASNTLGDRQSLCEKPSFLFWHIMCMHVSIIIHNVKVACCPSMKEFLTSNSWLF